MLYPPKLLGGYWGFEQGNYLIPFYMDNPFHQISILHICTEIPHVRQSPHPNGMLLGSTPLQIPTHHQPGRVGHNSEGG